MKHLLFLISFFAWHCSNGQSSFFYPPMSCDDQSISVPDYTLPSNEPIIGDGTINLYVTDKPGSFVIPEDGAYVFKFNTDPHITDFFDSIPGLLSKYNDFISKEGQPDRILWLKDAVDTYFSTGLETFHAFALYHGDHVTVMYEKQDSFGSNGSRRQYISVFKYRQNDRYFQLEWGADVREGRPIAFGPLGPQGRQAPPQGKTIQIGAPAPPYTVTINRFSDPRRLEQLTKILEALHFKYNIE